MAYFFFSDLDKCPVAVLFLSEREGLSAGMIPYKPY